MSEELLHIGEWTVHSRLIMGTGRHRSDEDLVASREASGAEVVTVAIRRLDLDTPGRKTILDVIDPDRYTVLPNTAGCRTPDEALLTARLARSLGLPKWVKLEVIPDPKYHQTRLDHT